MYGTALLALTSTGGSEITGTIGPTDTLVGSTVLQDGSGTAVTFAMGGTSEAYAGGTVTVDGSTAGDLMTAINDYTAGSVTGEGGAPADFTITATTDAGGSGGIYLQSGTEGNAITVTGNLADAYAENNATTVAGEAVVAGSASSVTIGSGSGQSIPAMCWAGNIAITNTVGGVAVTHTFVMGSGAASGSGAGTLTGTTSR